MIAGRLRGPALVLAWTLIICITILPGSGQEIPGEAKAAQPGAPGAGVSVSAAEVANAIDKAVRYVKSQQAEDGSWSYLKPEHRQGAAALAVLALAEAGLTESDPAVAAGLQFVLSQRLTMTYDSALTAMAIVSLNPGKYVNWLGMARDILVSGQCANGMWTYVAADARKGGGGDNSNTQFAILGLHAAAKLGLLVPEDVLKSAERHYTASQNKDGGWGYTPGAPSYGAMTAAGVGALRMLGARLYVEGDNCGQYSQDARMAAGLRWLENNFSAVRHPSGEQKRLFYYLYALERVGVLTGERYFAGHDWYVEGARFLVDTQSADGSWSSGRDILPDTCFALLFLAKGNVPVLVNKLDHGGEWNVDLHDAENLTAYISAKLGQRVGWQAVTARDSLDTLLAAPILYVTGHRFPGFGDGEMATLRAFFENGGFMLAEACCGSKDFDDGFRQFARSAFPEVPLTRLERSHPVYRAVFDLSSSTWPLEGLEAGCRVSVIYSPKDLSCAWEKNDLKKTEDAFQLGANIAAYVTGKEPLAPRLEQYKPLPSKEVKTAAPGAFTLAQVVYSTGNWNPHPAAGDRLIAFLNQNAGLTVSTRQVNVTLVDRNLSNYPFIYLTGCKRFSLSPEEKKALGEYLRRGGFLFSDAACGKSEFDESFRALMQELFPAAPLEPIPADSPVYRIGFDTARVTYTASVKELNPSLTTLTLYGLKIDGRIAVVYLPYDVGCALEKSPAYGSRGLVSEDAFKVAANVILFALSH